MFLTRTPTGLVNVTAVAPTPASAVVAGLAYDPNGALHVTTTDSPTDTYLGGMRVSPIGQVVVGNGNPPARPYVYNAGLPFDRRDGRLIRQEDTAPSPSDPYVAGVRVGPLGGVYFSTAAPGTTALDLDGDNLPDTLLYQDATTTVTIDADSVNVSSPPEPVVVLPRPTPSTFAALRQRLAYAYGWCSAALRRLHFPIWSKT